MGDTMAAELNQYLPLVEDPLLRAYVTRLGRQLVEASGRPGLNYRFEIINSAEANAFALPGGHIYLTRGLIERTRTGAELAGVLAHEVGHVAARHGVQKLERHLRTGSLVSMMYQMILGGEPALLRQRGLELAGVLWNAQHSREDEEEADRLAVEYLLESGLDPRGIVSLLETLLAEEQAAGSTAPASAWFSTHPMTQTRIAITREEIREELAEDDSRARRLQLASYPAFLRRVASLPPPPDALAPEG